MVYLFAFEQVRAAMLVRKKIHKINLPASSKQKLKLRFKKKKNVRVAVSRQLIGTALVKTKIRKLVH